MELVNFYIYYNDIPGYILYICGILIDRSPRSINQKVLKNEMLPKYFGPTADLSSHKYIFKPEDPMDNSTKVR